MASLEEEHLGDTEKRESSPVSSSLVHGPDLKVTVVILALCGFLYYVTTTFDEVSPLFTQNIAPQWFPRLLLATIVALTLVLPFEHRLLTGGKERLDAGRTSRIPLMAFATAGLLAAVVVSIKFIGTFLAMLLVCAGLPLLWGERRWHILVPYMIIFPAVVAFIFTQVLKVYFEPGLFGIEPKEILKWMQ